MKKSWFVLLPALALTLALLSGPAQGATSAEIQQEINRLQQEADAIAEAGAALEQQLQENAGQTATTIGQKAALDQSIHQTEAEIQNTDALLQQYSLLVAQRQSDLEAAEAAQAELQKTYQKRLRAMEENGDISYWAVLFQANSFSDLLGRIDMIREVAEADQRMLQDLKAQAQEIEAAREALRAEMEAQQQTRRDLEALQTTLEAQRAEADQLLLELAAAEESLSAEFQANQAQEDATRQEILEAQAAYEAALSAEEAARLAASNQNNLAGGGGSAASPGATGLIAPVDGPHVITDGSCIPPNARLTEFADSGIRFRLACYVDDFNNSAHYAGQIRELVYRQLNDDGIEIPYSRIQVDILSDPLGHRQGDGGADAS